MEGTADMADSLGTADTPDMGAGMDLVVVPDRDCYRRCLHSPGLV
jgi:hypothetical protein